jgi:hypothetical protein
MGVFISVHLGVVTMATFKGFLKMNENSISKGLWGADSVKEVCIEVI